MIACKARFTLRSLNLVTHRLAGGLLLFVLAGQTIQAQDYLAPRIYGFDRGPRDYTQRHLSDNLRFLLFRSEFKVTQTGYASNSGNLTNLQFATDFAQLASSGISGMAPNEIDRDLYNAERFTVRLYESLARKWENLNPIPGLLYQVIIRSPAYPFIVLEGLNEYALGLGTFPFTDDLRFRETSLASRQYGFGFRIIFD